ncbi:MAG: hypothetical protein IJC13_03715 [Clostridia bacterium]|nr:hypothetical protein [Clostridia bacterium]
MRSRTSVTVMAVAAEFHCDFLIPERVAPDHRKTVELCLFFCVSAFYHIFMDFATKNGAENLHRFVTC